MADLWTCVTSEDSDQPAHSFFTVRILNSKGYKFSSCGQQRFRPDYADAQADLCLHWLHIERYVFG